VKALIFKNADMWEVGYRQRNGNIKGCRNCSLRRLLQPADAVTQL